MATAMIIPTVATHREAGRAVYRLYECMTLTSGLYGLVVQYEMRPGSDDQRQLWSNTVDLVLEDLGTVVKFWEGIRSGDPIRAQLFDDLILVRQVGRLIDRIHKMQNLTSIWTPLYRWPRLLLHCERAWVHLIQELAMVDVQVRPITDTLIQHSKHRTNTLGRLESIYRDEQVRRNRSYRVATL